MTGRGREVDPTAPIFVVGSSTAALSAAGRLLDSHPAVSCGPPTGLLADLARSVGPEWHRYERFGFPRSYWLEMFRETYQHCHVIRAHRFGKLRWADATRRHIGVLPFVDELFPTSQLVHLVGSRSWSRHAVTAREYGRRLPPSRYCEVPARQVLFHPKSVAVTLWPWLALAPPPWSLQHRPEKPFVAVLGLGIRRLTRNLTRHRGQQL